MTGSAYAINTASVVHETIDGETIAIHMATGAYYSLAGSGAELWSVIDGGADLPGLLEFARARWDGDPELIEAGVSGLVDELLAEDLVISVADRATVAPATAPPRAPFDGPTLHKYTDMQEFMLVDPLHDVDAGAGWPHVDPG